MVFAVVVIGELLAFILTLSPFKQSGDRWSELSIISLFIQWVALTSAAALCIARPYLEKLNEKYAAVWSYLLLLLVTGLVSEAAYWVMQILNINSALSQQWHLNLILRNLAISAIVSAVTLRYFYVQHQWKQHIQAESQARIEALQARIHPHFLFNSMNTIASLTRSQPELAEEAVEDLADLFRQTLADSRRLVTLEDELEVCQRYLRIEQLRMDERLKLAWHIDEIPKDALVPMLSIQPLLENAIYHGIERMAEGGVIEVKGIYQDGMIRLTVSNPLPKSHQSRPRRGNKFALNNIRHRFEAFYGTKGKVHINNSDNIFEIQLSFPYQRDQT